MALDRSILQQLRKYAAAFREARDRNANESDTVMYLVKFFEEIFGYDSLKGEISKELAIKDRYCDVALKIDGVIRALVEGKAAGVKGLVDKHIEQAENYASKAGLRWVLLTNGIITEQEDPAVAKVLNAAAMTYVAATLTAILQLLYFLFRAGLLGGHRDE